MRNGGWKLAGGFLGAIALGVAVSMSGLSLPSGAAADDRKIAVAGGGPAGIYYNYATELSGVASQELPVRAEAQETGGSVENLHMVSQGEAAFGFTAADAAADAVAGHPPFDEPLEVQAVARVYDDFVHLVVAQDSDIDDVADIKGRKVSLGAPGSGTAVIANRLLNTADIDVADLDDAQLGIDASIQGLRDGEIEAFFWSGGLSTPGLHELAQDMPIRLVPLAGLVDHVSERYDHVYRHAIIPRGTYGMTEDVAAMAVPNYLVTHATEDADLVHDVLDVLFRERADLARRVSAVGQLDHRRAIFTEPVELHEGALGYYRSAKP